MGIVERLKEEFEIHDEWLHYQIHPDTPLDGIRWENYFKGMNVKEYFSRLAMQGRELGVKFSTPPLMSNSKLAMQAGELAREHGVYDLYHAAMFKAFFTDCINIGDFEVIAEIITSLGLAKADLEKAIQEGKYIPILEETKKRAAENMVTAVPTFFIEGGPKITGAQPLETFKKTLERLVL